MYRKNYQFRLILPFHICRVIVSYISQIDINYELVITTDDLTN